jgi:amino acid transporter
MGVETPLINGGEIKNAKRTVPLAIFWGIGGMLLLVMSIQLITQGVLGETIVLHKDAPLAAVGGVVAGKAGFALVILATALSMLGLLSGEILSIPRILFAGARDGLMPKPLASVHPHFFTPHIAVAFYASLGFLFAIAGGFKQLAIISSACTLLVYLGTVLATLKLRKTALPASEKTFRVPGGATIPLLATGGILWLLSGLTKPEFMGISIFIVVLSVIYVLIKRIKKNL